MGLHRGKYILLCLLHCHLISCQSSWDSVLSRVDKNFTELVEFDGYKSEVHHVTTKDGYELRVFRVRTRAGSRANEQEPILYTHGMYESGDDCVIPGPRAAHCYLYADAGHDVWVLNMRGSRYSRAHNTLNPDKDAKYWDFSFEEMALYDLPASIDYILKKTRKKRIVYISHSQGAAILMLLCSKITQYNDKVRIGFGLSPTVFLSHYRFIVVEIEKILSNFLLWMDRTGTHFEILGHGGFIQKLARSFCSLNKSSYPVCSALIFFFIGYNRFHITPEVLPVVFGHLPSGTSVKNFLRWGLVAKNGFSEYDYGEEENLRRYGVKQPPLFDLSKVTMKWILLGSANDYIADLKDVAFTKSQLPNAEMCVLSDHSIGHLDFIYGTSVAEFVVPIILSALDKNKFVCM